MNRVYKQAILDQKLPAHQARDLFERILDMHSQHKSPTKSGVFTETDAAAVNQFASRNFFRVYSLHLHTVKSREHITVKVQEPERLDQHRSSRAAGTSEVEQAWRSVMGSASSTVGPCSKQSDGEAGADLHPVQSDGKEGGLGTALQAEVGTAFDLAFEVRLATFEQRLQQFPAPRPFQSGIEVK